MTAHSKDEGLRECPFCGRNMRVQPDGFYRHAFQRRGALCVAEAIAILSGDEQKVAAWNHRSSSAERGMREALQSIWQYGADTLSGRADGGLNDWQWQHDAVVEMTKRARLALSARAGEKK